MNEYRFKDISLNQTVDFEYKLTAEKMESFLQITGDKNPLHNDVAFARECGYPEKVVYGMLTSAILSTLAGVYLPGKYSLIHSVEIGFLRPVFLSNCPLSVHAEVISKDERFSQITLKFYIIDSKHKKVCRGILKVGVTE